ncbi:MAG: right-handed parallel beta-helix repeat-containing protein [Candidatus Hodarchaeales archaeon]|jgi:parallel beta-helix repeat protein
MTSKYSSISILGFVLFSLLFMMIIRNQPILESDDFNTRTHNESNSNYKIILIPQLHSPISINSNKDLNGLGFSGSGSFTDPYRIMSLNITSSSEFLISISNTDVYIQIEDNYLNGLTLTSFGIVLNNASNIKITNNELLANGDGLNIKNSTEIEINNNEIYTNEGFGIFQDRSDNCTITQSITIP